LHCPWCSENGKNGKGVKGRPYMCCWGCSRVRTTLIDHCAKMKCGVKFS
jgi:hypothetical protein